MAFVDAHDPGQVLGGAVVDVEARAVGDLRQLLERDVEPVAQRIGTRLHQHVAAAQVAALDPREGERDPLPGLGAVDRPVVHLDAAHAHVEPRWLGSGARRLRRPSRTRAFP